jgi:hypothetical protein
MGFIRQMLVAAVLVLASFTTAFTVGTMVPAHAATVNGSPADVAACVAVYRFHHVNADEYRDEAVWQAAYRRAWQLAGPADPGVRADIRRYLADDRGWSWVADVCMEETLPVAS